MTIGDALKTCQERLKGDNSLKGRQQNEFAWFMAAV